MKTIVLGLGKMIFQVSIIIFIIGYCFGFWFKGKNKVKTKPRLTSIQPSRRPANMHHSTQSEAA